MREIIGWHRWLVQSCLHLLLQSCLSIVCRDIRLNSEYVWLRVLHWRRFSAISTLLPKSSRLIALLSLKIPQVDPPISFAHVTQVSWCLHTFRLGAKNILDNI